MKDYIEERTIEVANYIKIPHTLTYEYFYSILIKKYAGDTNEKV